ncbi:MAG TPA: hypothetical protein VNA69_23600 [Thermoanaerobaculia bacterium]|nr:hypothetical protein [Thermoanaerobaculia bacterium]
MTIVTRHLVPFRATFPPCWNSYRFASAVYGLGFARRALHERKVAEAEAATTT